MPGGMGGERKEELVKDNLFVLIHVHLLVSQSFYLSNIFFYCSLLQPALPDLDDFQNISQTPCVSK